jgi:hypothetical protein
MSHQEPVKTFGTKSTRPISRVPISLWVERDDEPEEHHFLARKLQDFKAMVMTAIQAGKDDATGAMGGMMAMMRRILDNKDGVPAEWTPKLVEPPKPSGNLVLEPAEPSWPGAQAFTGELVDDTERDYVPSFRAPTRLPEDHPLFADAGKLVPMTRADEFTAVEVGSSRRRWDALLSDESDVTIKEKDLMDMFEYMTSLAASRPTQPSS